MSETISEPKRPANSTFFGASPDLTRRMTVAAVALGITVLISFLVTRYFAYQNVQENFYGQALVPAKQAFDFRLVDQDGRGFQLSQLRGKVVLFSFGFTHCPNVCPTTLSDLAKIYRALPANAQKAVQVVFVTVDPKRDTPAMMKDYVPYFDSSFIGLTGTESQIDAAVKAYGAYYELVHDSASNPDQYTVNHSAITYLISPDGKWRLLYNFDQLGDSKKMVRDIERVLAASS
jgi:protein SCO1/2